MGVLVGNVLEFSFFFVFVRVLIVSEVIWGFLGELVC